jgi:hypothetical protein
MNQGIDLQGSFIQLLVDLGLPTGVAKAVWIPLPMFLMLAVATVGVLVSVWLERKISAAVQQRIGPEYAGPLGVLATGSRRSETNFKRRYRTRQSRSGSVYPRPNFGGSASVYLLFNCPIWAKYGNYRFEASQFSYGLPFPVLPRSVC